MSLPIERRHNETDGLTTITKLLNAFHVVLGESLEDQIRAEVETREWYDLNIPFREVFRLWVFENGLNPVDPLWIFAPLRSTERRLLCDALQIPREEIVGQSPREIASLVLERSRVPVMLHSGRARSFVHWASLRETVMNGEDERAASIARIRAERLLRELILFYCEIGYESVFLEIVQQPGTLKIPKKLAAVGELSVESREAALSTLLIDDGWADLGFLNLALRKFSKRLEEAGKTHLNGKHLVVFTGDDQTAFDELAKALQPYAHDRPSSLETRQSRFADALGLVLRSLTSMQTRATLPSEVLVVEAGRTFLGESFRGLDMERKIRLFHCDQPLPDIGDRLLVVSSTDSEGSMALWIRSTWRE